MAAWSEYGTERRARERIGHQRHALGDEGVVPPAAVLLVERDQRAIGPVRSLRRASVSSMSARRPVTSPSAGSVSCTARVRRIASVVRSARWRLVARRGRVALVEDQVQHVQHDAQTISSLVVGREPELRAGRLDRLLGPADPLRHRRLGNQERASDLRRGQTADRAQGQCELRRRRQRRVTAEEQQRERVVVRRRDREVARHARSRRSTESLAPAP